MTMDLVIGQTYRDKRGVDWTIVEFLHDEGTHYTIHPEGAYVEARRPDRARRKIVKRKTFIASLEPPISPGSDCGEVECGLNPWPLR